MPTPIVAPADRIVPQGDILYLLSIGQKSSLITKNWSRRRWSLVQQRAPADESNRESVYISFLFSCYILLDGVVYCFCIRVSLLSSSQRQFNVEQILAWNSSVVGSNLLGVTFE